MSKPIGGYFELESNNFKSIYHDNAIAVNSGRNALEYALLINNYKKIYIPHFTCNVILQPLKKLRIDFELYHLDKNFSPMIGAINNDEALLYVNYFGIMNNTATELAEKYKNIIIDNAQAFFTKPLNMTTTFYSPRKFFGLPDGGFLYPNNNTLLNLDIDKSDDRISHLISRVEYGAEAGYPLFIENDAKMNNLPLKLMSRLTTKLLNNINFKLALKKRNENFSYLHNVLGQKNMLTRIIEAQSVNGPMIYPYLINQKSNISEKLINDGIFNATYWPDLINNLEKNTFEEFLANKLIALPIDQRYGKDQMDFILEKLDSYD